MGRQKNGPNKKQNHTNLFVQLHDLFSLFSRTTLFGALRDMMVSYIYVRFLLFAMHTGKRVGKGGGRGRTAESWRNDEKYTLLYTL
jgi:hypothetical protein